MSRQCITCGEEIHPKRLEILPHTQTCTQHSTVEKKAAVTVQMGEGDHTWIETYAIDREDLRRIEEAEKSFRQQIVEETTPEIIITDKDDTIPTIDDFENEGEYPDLDIEE
jgi:hypothetical protein